MNEFVIGRTLDLPSKLLEQVVRELKNFTVPLNFRNNPVGSGTLIKYQDSYGILTASHVIHKSGLRMTGNSDQHLGIGILETAHKFSIPCKLLSELDIGSPPKSEYGPLGPDAAIILLPCAGNFVSNIQMKKTFYNLETHEDRTISDDEQLNIHMSGFPAGARKQFDDLDTGETCIVDRHIVFSGDVYSNKSYGIEEFDYIDIRVRDRVEEEGLVDYQGMSGGGVWDLPVEVESADDLSSANIKRIVLTGIVFFEDREEGDKPLLRGHGSHTILKAKRALESISGAVA